MQLCVLSTAVLVLKTTDPSLAARFVGLEALSTSNSEMRGVSTIRRVGGRGWRRREDQGAAVGKDPDDVGAAADLEAFVPGVVELSVDALEVRGDGLTPLTSSQPAKTISWTSSGRKRNV